MIPLIFCMSIMDTKRDTRVARWLRLVPERTKNLLTSYKRLVVLRTRLIIFIYQKNLIFERVTAPILFFCFLPLFILPPIIFEPLV